MKKALLFAMTVFLVLSILSGAAYTLSGDDETPTDEQWTCAACGREANTGKFCTDCGTMKPQTTEPGVWTCSCGVKNDGKFCTKCGQPKPSDTPLPDPQPKYKCKNCGWESKDLDNPPDYCAECGEPILIDGQWRCAACGYKKNTDSFCAECGKPNISDKDEYICSKCGWEPEDLENPPKYCPNCSDIFDEDDLLVLCTWCKGAGKLLCLKCFGYGNIQGRKCKECDQGYRICAACKGRGKERQLYSYKEYNSDWPFATDYDFSVPGYKN